MYDPNSEPREFVADDPEAAIRKAVQHFGVDADALTISGFPAGAVYGLGGRAVIVATPRDRQPARREPGERREERRDRDRDRDRDRPRREGRREGRNGRPERQERAPRARAEAADVGPSKGTALGEVGPVGQFLLGVVERLGLGSFELGETNEGDLVVFELRGQAARALSSGDGRPVDALQLLTNQALARTDPERRAVVDVEGNPETRERFLSRLAERVVRRAQETGRAVALDPMNARDRRMIHLAARDQDGIATMSIGEGRYRQVVVVPEGAPEYEDARRKAEAAAEQQQD